MVRMLEQVGEYLRQSAAPIHPAGWPFIAGGLAAAVLLGLLFAPLFWLGLLITAWMAYFFRDPLRVTPQGDDLVVSPGDGVIQAITARGTPELDLGEAPSSACSCIITTCTSTGRRSAGGSPGSLIIPASS